MRRILLLAAFVLAALPAAEGVQATVLDGITSHPNRLPGSPGHAAAVEAVTAALQGAGLAVHRQEYGTVVPRTRRCVLTVDGTEIAGVLPMAPNGVVPPTTWGRDLEGPAVWLGDGTLAEMDGLPVAGSIAFVRIGSPNLPEIFAQGARAVVAVGEQATQWQAARMFSEAPIASPRAWLPSAAAAVAGLTANPAQARRASLRIEVDWTDAETANLWTLIPPADDAPPEAASRMVVLAAELATSGVVPDATPGGRQAANAALLAELAVRLHQRRPGCSVLVVFLGSHYGAQDGARMLYWAVRKARMAAGEQESLSERAAWIEELSAVCDERLRLLAGDQVLASSGTQGAWIRNQLRRLISARVNGCNYEARHLQLERKAAGERKDAAAVAAFDVQLAAIKVQVDRGNGLRRQVHERTVSDAEAFSGICAQLVAEVTALRDWLAADRQRLASAAKLAEAIAGRQVVAHFGLDFADAERRWLASSSGADCESLLVAPQPGYFSKHLDAYQQSWERVARDLPGAAPMHAPDPTATYGYEQLSGPGRRQVACVIPLGMGLMASQLTTLGDPLDADEMPVDPAPDLAGLAAPLEAWLRDVSRSDLPPKTGMPVSGNYDAKLVWRRTGGDLQGLRIDRLSRGSEEVDGPAAGGLLFVRRQLLPGTVSLPPCGRSNIPIARINPAGYVFAPGLSDSWTRSKTNAIAFDAVGAPEAYFDGMTSSDAMTYNIRLFSGYGNVVYTPFLPQDYGVAGQMQRLGGRTDSDTKRRFGRSGTGGVMAVTSEARSLKLIGNGLFLLGSTEARPQGVGIVPDPSDLLSLDALRRSAADTCALNSQRLGVLRAKDLINRPVERLHAACRDNLEMAEEARRAGSISKAAAHEVAAATLAYRAHGPLRDNANDLLRAVVALLVLSIPFAFALERLAIGAVSIYRQILGFLGIFLGTFALLYVTHPAFAMANSPMIIFLAFVIILLSGFVISVVMGKFKHELRAMQGLAAKSHSSGNANSTTLAAIVIGIAGMRNRPMKSFLTISTVTLLTFTILVFSSFQSGRAVVESYLGRARGADRIELHQPSFMPIPDRLVEAIANLHGQRFEVFRRSAVIRDPLGSESDNAVVLLDPGSGRALRMEALLGLDRREAARHPGIAALLEGEVPAGARPVWLSQSVASRWRLKPGAEVRIRGTAFVLAGIFSEDKMRAIENVDGTRLTPPDFDATFAANGILMRPGSFTSSMQTFDATSFIFASPGLTAILTNEDVIALRGGTNFLSLYPKEGADVGRAAHDLAGMFNGPVLASSGEGVRRWFYTDEITGGGYLDLLVPLLLGGLIIFTSLLGSIVDRQKEIFTYSALGLSPREVGMLFFAESAVIAVVGGMGGYLIGQLAAKVLNLLSGQGLVTVPDLNFSSLSSLVTIGIVMAMVMLSTIYPALLAGRSANPGVNRSWKMPKPEGGKLTFTFPFTVPAASFGGIVAFINEHFRNHGDAALDVFAAKEVSLHRSADGRMGIRAEIALAPFDLGVYQRFAMFTRASDIPGIDEVVVEIELLNGAPGTWLRGNRAFVADLREQFLIWRALPAEAVVHYQGEASKVLAEATEVAS